MGSWTRAQHEAELAVWIADGRPEPPAPIVSVALQPIRAPRTRAHDTEESTFRDLFVKQIGGRAEVELPFGRADVYIEGIAVEVEPSRRWQHGMRQALAYAAMSANRDWWPTFDRDRRFADSRDHEVFMADVKGAPAIAGLAIYGDMSARAALAIYRRVSRYGRLWFFQGTRWEYVTTAEIADHRWRVDWAAVSPTSSQSSPRNQEPVTVHDTESAE